MRSAAKYSLRLEVKSHEDPDLLLFFDQVVGDRSLDGIIIVPQFLTDYPFLHILQSKNFPYVMFRPARFWLGCQLCRHRERQREWTVGFKPFRAPWAPQNRNDQWPGDACGCD